jgi:hypothetical protein
MHASVQQVSCMPSSPVKWLTDQGLRLLLLHCSQAFPDQAQRQERSGCKADQQHDVCSRCRARRERALIPGGYTQEGSTHCDGGAAGEKGISKQSIRFQQ